MPSDWEWVCWIYFDDLGQAYRTRAKYGTVKQTDPDGRPLVGGRTPHDPSEPRKLPFLGRSLKLRTVTMVNLENGRRLRVVVYSLDAPLWVGAAKTIQMQDYEPIPGDPNHVNPVQRPYQVRGRKDELYAGRRRRAKTTPSAPRPVDSAVFDSTIEEMFAQAWERATNLKVVAQHPVLGYRLDFAHLASRTAIELDGYYYHADPARFRKDRERDRALAAQGWHVVRFAGEEVLEDVTRCVDEALQLIRRQSSGAGDS